MKQNAARERADADETVLHFCGFNVETPKKADIVVSGVECQRDIRRPSKPFWDPKIQLQLQVVSTKKKYKINVRLNESRL